ncbi:argininosuccinate lyase [Martelella sp. HB161492]|uniref:argininosuccinate lyase n=1 Tax=Martelella sp. HB161492 TaxID=2720726 RepID=UPI0015917014|nr:argininosuccinate lyase [Martelella sp. HB161492]
MSVDNPSSGDTSRFPDPVYKETLLKSLFDGAKTYFVEGFRAIDRAHLVMLTETGILSSGQAAKIADALVAIDAEVDPAKLEYTGEVEDFFFLIEKELKARLGADLGGRLHTARSRNDIDHTLFKLALRSRIDLFLDKAVQLLAAMIETAKREKATLIVAYTHGQPAQPTTFGHYLGAAIEVLIRDLKRMLEARKIVDLSPMGAAAITTSGFPIDRQLMASLLGFAAPLRNSYSCIAAVDYTTATYSAIELTFLHLGRLIQDFQFWTSFEVAQLYVPNALVQISSIMPQKRNPVPIEHMRHLSSQTVGRAQSVLTIMHNTPFTDMNDSEGETQTMGFQAFDCAFRVLDLLVAFIAQVKVNGPRVAANLDRSCITITELADSLVRREDLSFRVAHEIAADVARAVVKAESSLTADGYEPFLKAFEQHAGRASGLDEDAFRDIVSPEYFVSVRKRYGGPAAEPLGEALAFYDGALGDFSDKIAANRAHLHAASANLEKRFQALRGEG